MRSLLVAALLAAFVVTDGLPVMDHTLGSIGEIESLVEVESMELSSPVLPLTVAKSACQAGWLETKKQCNIMTASTSETGDMLKGAIKAAGESVLSAVMRAVGDHADKAAKAEEAATSTNGTNTTATKGEPSLERTVRSKLAFARLGETADSMADAPSPEAMKTLAHMSCQALWQVVESVCTKVDTAAEEGHGAVAETAKAEGKGFTDRTQVLAHTDIPEAQEGTPAPAPAPAGNATRLGETKYEEDQSMGSLDSSDRAVQEMYKSMASNSGVSQM